MAIISKTWIAWVKAGAYMIDFQSSTQADFLKFMEHFPYEGDLTLQILKGHLLVEELMRDILKIQLFYPEALLGSKGTSFDCHQVICLVEAITPNSQVMPWIWLAAKKLNNVRNDLAHNLSPRGFDNKISDFINCVRENTPEEMIQISKDLGWPEDNDLPLMFMSMCTCLASLKSVLSHYRNKVKDSSEMAEA